MTHPVPEYATIGELASRYSDMKIVLQMPWMGVVTIAFTHYPSFFGELWCGLRPLCDSQPFVDAVGEVRNFCEKIMLALNPPPLIERLAENGYGGREIDFPNLMIATLTRSLLLGGRFGRAGDNVPACEMRHAPDVAKPFVLMEH